jgi:CRP-like cAMP-binding protein
MAFDINQFYFDSTKILEGLSAKNRWMLEKGIVKKRIKSGKTIYRQSTIPRGVYILRKGKVKIYQTNQDAVKQIMYIYTVGEMFGYRPLICNEKHPVTATALEDCSYDFISREHFLKCLSASHELCRSLLVSLSHEFSVWTNNISVFARYPVKSRVALGLLILQEKYKTSERENEVSLSRSEFASYVGTVKETVVRIIQELRTNNIVETHGSKIRILKPDELKKYVNFY